MFPHFLLKVKNMDFNGLFGNITSVIELSQRLYDALQETDSIGNFFRFCHTCIKKGNTNTSWLFFFFKAIKELNEFFCIND